MRSYYPTSVLGRMVRRCLVACALASATVQAQQDSTLFALSIEDLLNLNVQISTALKSSTTPEDAPAAVFVITHEDLDQMGILTLGEALNIVPGFTVGKSIQNGQQKTIYVRGEFSSQSEGILLLTNGQRMNDGITGGGMAFHPDIPLDNIKQIEVIRGPASALYGANAFVAVVNLITTDAQDVSASDVSMQAGTNGNLAARGTVKIFSGSPVQAVLYGSLFRSDDPIPQRDIHQEILDTTTSSYVPFELANRVNVDQTEILNLGTSIRYGKLQVDGSFDRSTGRNNWGSGASDRRSGFQNYHTYQNIRWGAQYATDFSKGHRLHVLAGYAHHQAENVFRVENFRSILSPGFNPPGNKSIFESDLATSTVNWETYVELNFSRRHRMVTGINVHTDIIETIDNSTAILDLNGDGIFDAFSADDTLDTHFKNQTRANYGAFIQHTWAPVSSINITGGARLDHTAKFGSKINPRLALVVRPVTHWTAKAMYGRAYRTPTFFETNQSDFSTIGGSGLVVNPNLKPETIETYELQLTYSPVDNLSFHVNVFHNDIQHVIRPVPFNQAGIPTQSRWENAGSRDWKGLEAGCNFAWGRHLSGFVNYSLTQAADEQVPDVENPVFGIPKHSVNFGVNVGTRRWNLNVNANSRFGWNDVPQSDSGGIISERIDLKSYAVINTRFILRDVWRTLRLTLDVRNVLDQTAIFTDDRQSVPQGIAGNGRTFIAGLSYTF